MRTWPLKALEQGPERTKEGAGPVIADGEVGRLCGQGYSHAGVRCLDWNGVLKNGRKS